jgi:hypothetical protein
MENQLKKEKTRKDKPPYIGVGALKRLLKLLSSRSFNKIVAEDLTARGFVKSVSFQALQSLRFLGLLDDSGNALKKMKILALKGKEKEEKLQELIKEAYSELFASVVDGAPYKLQRDELHNEFVALYGLSSRLATTATPAFLWLCAEAGFEVSERPESREKKETRKIKKNFQGQKELKLQPIQFSSPTSHEGKIHDIEIAGTGIRLIIPHSKKVDDEIAQGGLIQARKEIVKFAAKVGLGNILLNNENDKAKKISKDREK